MLKPYNYFVGFQLKTFRSGDKFNVNNNKYGDNQLLSRLWWLMFVFGSNVKLGWQNE